MSGNFEKLKKVGRKVSLKMYLAVITFSFCKKDPGITKPKRDLTFRAASNGTTSRAILILRILNFRADCSDPQSLKSDMERGETRRLECMKYWCNASVPLL